MNPLNRAIARACTDAAYRARLLANARLGLAEAGIDVPDEIDVRVHENTPGKVLIVLPTAKGLELSESTRRTPCGPVADVPEGLELEWRESPDIHRAVLSAKGRVDGSTAGALRRELERSLVTVDLDMSAVSFLGSAGVGALLAAQQRLKGQDCGLTLLLVPDEIRNVFEVSGVADLFTIHGLSEYVALFPKGALLLFGGEGPTSPDDALSQRDAGPPAGS